MRVAPQVLAISSHVAYGTVGLRAFCPAVEALGCEAMAIPTVVLSNHPGHSHVAGAQLQPASLTDTTRALAANGWLKHLRAVNTGYLPTDAHVAAAREAILQVLSESPRCPFILDPICGDDPRGLYLDRGAATALRDSLLPMAQIATPNRFELSWLSGKEVTSIGQATTAARSLGIEVVIATSIPAAEGQIATVLITQNTSLAFTANELNGVPHGTGDLLTGLITGYLAHGAAIEDAVEQGHGTLQAVIAKSLGKDRLDLSPLTALAKVT